METLFDTLFGTYYGLDWASMGLGFAGAWTIGNRRSIGHVLTAASVILACATAIIAGQYGFITANLISLVIHLRIWRKWRAEDTRPTDCVA